MSFVVMTSDNNNTACRQSKICVCLVILTMTLLYICKVPPHLLTIHSRTTICFLSFLNSRSGRNSVHVEEGRFACSCGFCQENGAPHKYVMATIHFHRVAFNPIAHIHPAYLKAFSPLPTRKPLHQTKTHRGCGRNKRNRGQYF